MGVGAQLPVLAVGQVPEVDRRLRVEAGRGDRRRGGRTSRRRCACGRCRATGRGGPGRSRGGTTGTRREEGVVVDAPALLLGEPGERRRAAPAVHRHAAVGVGHPHRPAEHRPLVEVVLGVPVGRQLVEVRVHVRAVVALAVVVEEELPVGFDLVDRLVDRAQLGDAASASNCPWQRRQRLGERRRVGGEVHEEEPLPARRRRPA